MTGFERYHAALDGKPLDFSPRTPILMRLAAESIGKTYGEFVSDHRVLVEANLYCAEAFGMDQVSTISDPYRETAGFGGIVKIEASGPSCSPLMPEEIDLSILEEPDPETSPRMRDRLDAIRLYRERTGEHYSILGWVEGAAAEAADVHGVENFLADLMEEPEESGELMNRCLAVAIAFAQAQIRAGADTIGIGDAVASQVSPDRYEALILPHQKKLVAAIQGAGARARMHICGDITHLLPGLATLGLDAIDVDHMVDLAKVRTELGSTVLIGANLDPVADILKGNPSSIREKLQQCQRIAGERFAVNAGCEIPPGCPRENLAALCEPLAPAT